MAKLFVLRAHWTEYWNDADEGLVTVADVYADISFAADPAPLHTIRDNLVAGYKNNYWSLKRAHELKALWAGYDDNITYRFEVEDITHLFLTAGE